MSHLGMKQKWTFPFPRKCEISRNLVIFTVNCAKFFQTFPYSRILPQSFCFREIKYNFGKTANWICLRCKTQLDNINCGNSFECTVLRIKHATLSQLSYLGFVLTCPIHHNFFLTLHDISTGKRHLFENCLRL
jgi:hypothetical protein